MSNKSRKICITAPTRIRVAQELLKKAGCEVVLGKSVDDFPEYRYQRKELVDLIGDADALAITAYLGTLRAGPPDSSGATPQQAGLQ